MTSLRLAYGSAPERHSRTTSGIINTNKTTDRGGATSSVEPGPLQVATLHLWDNAHSTDEHHEHEYTSSQGKRDPTVHPFDSVNQAMAAAMTRATEDWPAILESWRSG